MNSDIVKALCLQYWRYEKQTVVVALEADGMDVACIKNRYLVETEVKISIADLKKDAEKEKHFRIRKLLGLPVDGIVSAPFSAHQFHALHEDVDWIKKWFHVHQYYFAVPDDICDKALTVINDIYPYAGLLKARLYRVPNSYTYGAVDLVKTPERIPVNRMDFQQVVGMVKAQSATLTRLALKVGRDKMSQIVPNEEV